MSQDILSFFIKRRNIMSSYEAIKNSISKVGVKSIAADLGLSTSLIYKWCQPTHSADSSGADNPLDRINRIYQLTGDVEPIAWLCHQADGFFVPNNPIASNIDKIPLLKMTRRIVREFSELLDVMTESIENDGEIDLKEATRIRKEWEELKSSAESFIVLCEKGHYKRSK